MVRKLEDLENKPEEIDEVREWAMEIMQFIFSESQRNLVANNTPDTGFLLGSGIPPFWDNDKIIFEYNAPYATFIEWGSPPHPVDPNQLVGWVRRKLKIKDKKALSVAWAIATKISRVGTDAQPFVRNSINAAVRRYNLKIKPLSLGKGTGF